MLVDSVDVVVAGLVGVDDERLGEVAELNEAQGERETRNELRTSKKGKASGQGSLELETDETHPNFVAAVRCSEAEGNGSAESERMVVREHAGKEGRTEDKLRE